MLLSPRIICVKYIFGTSLCSLRQLHCCKSLWLQSVYSEDDQKKLLDFLNTMDERKAVKMRLSVNKYDRIITHRAHHGEFSKLNDILSIEGLTPRSVCTFFNIVLRRLALAEKDESHIKGTRVSQPSKQSFKTLSQVFYTVPKHSVLKNATSIASLAVNENHLSWMKVRSVDEWKSQEVKDWGVITLTKKKFQEADLISMAKEVSSVLPSADMYVLEKESYVRKLKSHYLSLQPQLTAISIALICNKMNFNTDQIYLLKAGSPGRMFNLAVGKELVSPQNYVTQFLQHGHVEKTSNNSFLIASLEKLSVSDQMIHKYLQSSNLEKEFMCIPLLVLKAFIEVVFQDFR